MGPLRSLISLIKFLVYCSPVLFLYFPEKTKAIGSHFHNVEVTSLLAAETCDRQSSTGSNSRKYSTTLEVVHMFGPCSPQHEHTKNKPSLVDNLSHEQSRVDLIQTRPKQNILRNNKASLSTQSGMPLNTPTYVVTIGLGTPRQNVTLIFDTGSDLTWTQCQPCLECYEQRGPVYDPFYSSTYSKISCGSECYKVGYVLSCFKGRCAYKREYLDGSYSEGVVSIEKLTITPDVFEDFFFGCGQKNKGGTFGETAGLLGLGRTANEMSFLYQTAQKYDRYFSYCLPSTGSSIGHLTFGRNKSKHSTKNVMFTPLIPHPDFYRIGIMAISVGKTRLPIQPSVFHNSRTIIDSGATITRLPHEAYVLLRDAFRHKMGSSYATAPAHQIFDTCYYINNQTNVKYPFVSFTFSGGVEVKLHPSGIIYPVNSTMVCFAFAGSTNPERSVFGNIQQKTLEIVYDLALERLGFGQGGCK